MTSINRQEPLLLFIVDVCLFLVALWLTLLLRYLAVPGLDTFYNHLAPFSFLFFAWVIVFFIAGLYDKHTALFRSRLPTTILNAQTINVIIAALFFFLVPNVGVTPKASLGIYLIISSALILLWRFSVLPRLSIKNRQRGILLGNPLELAELQRELESNPRYPFVLSEVVDPNLFDAEKLAEAVREVCKEGVAVIVLDTGNAKVQSILPSLYDLVFAGVQIVDAAHLYEEIFDREPLTLLEHRWLVENISLAPRAAHDLSKRLIDLLIAIPLGLLSLIFYPFIALAILLDDGLPVFIFQERVGKEGALIRIAKFRSMKINGHEKVTRVGRFLRATRLDEIPQLMSVITGEQSLIGPRPELPQYVKLYTERIPYYNVRHLIKPGLSGWAQIQNIIPPKFEVQLDATKLKLSYDLYYIKHRSLWLDIKIGLKTIRTLLSRSGI